MALELSNVPEPVNILARQGTTFTFTMTLTDADGDPIAIPAMRMSIRKKTSSKEALLALSVGSGIVISGGGSNVATVTITAAQSADLEVGSWVYDIERDTAGGETHPVLGGSFRVVGEAAR